MGELMSLEFEQELNRIVDAARIAKQEPMKKHTTFRVGGPADYFVTPKTVEEVAQLVKLCRQMDMPYYVVGNGSNLLVSDGGYRGVIIQIYKEMNAIRFEETPEGAILYAQAGALLSKVGSAALVEGLTGVEFAAGIPGTVGGAMVMNAGAYGGEMKDVVRTVTVLTPEGQVMVLANEELDFGYRTSVVSKKEYIVLEASFSLSRGDKDAIKARMEELREQRTTKQPLEYPSAGSTFKRPKGYFAGKLIQDAGLRGFRIGGAQVSEKHCGFVINAEDATAEEIWTLMCRVSALVEEKFGVRLEPEVKRLGEF